MLEAPLEQFFSSSAAIRLLRSTNAPWVLPFFQQQFKRAGRIAQAHSTLVSELTKQLRSSSQAADASAQAERYLVQWCSRETGWLKRFIDEQHVEPMYQLTPDTERVLAFVGELTSERPILGTRVRLQSILELLQSVATKLNTDPRARLEQLEQERRKLDAEIAHLQAAEGVPIADPAEIREQFGLAAAAVEQLKSEFRAVEERFKAIARDVQQRASAAESTRGAILEQALDEEAALQHSDHGKSFFQFLRILHSPQSQDRIQAVIRELGRLQAVAGMDAELESIRTMTPTLIAEAEKILRTTQHLSGTLRRLLDSKSNRHQRQLTHLLRDLTAQARRLAEHPPEDVGLDVEVELELQLPIDRPFWMPTEEFEEVALRPVAIDSQEQARALLQLVSLERLDWQALRRNITLCTRSGATDLEELLLRFPLQMGAVELLGYLQIAYDDGHRIERDQRLTVPVDLGEHFAEAPRAIELPNLVFLPAAMRRHVAAAPGEPSAARLEITS